MMRLFLTAELPAGWDVGAMAAGLQKNLAEITANHIVGAVIVAVVSLALIKLLLRLLDQGLARSRLDDALKKLLRALMKGGLLFIAAIVVLARLGIEVTSLVAVLSVIGLAFSLALQNILSNVAGGMQLLASHPFKPGDFIEVGECSGYVTDIGMFYTRLSTYDKKLIELPNSAIVSANIINHFALPTRRVDLVVPVAYTAPVDAVLDILLGLAKAHRLVLDDPAPAVHVKEYGSYTIRYSLRAWCASADYWTVYLELMDSFKPAFDEAGIQMIYPHINVHMADEKQAKRG